MYNYKLPGFKEIKIKRVGDYALEVDIEGHKAGVLTEDLAVMVRSELPKDRARDMFAEIDEKSISTGKVRVKIRANYDIKRGDYIVTSFDINRYLDGQNNKTGVRVNSFGFIY